MVRNLRNRHVCSLMLAVVAMFIVANRAFAQIDKDAVAHAVKVLKNLETDKSHEWAITTLTNAAVNDSSAYAMNCLGIAYMAGLGVNVDSTKAVEWLERAGREGYAEAYHNLGFIYKYSRCGVRQDFQKAYQYFVAGADKGSVSCMYDKGFMLYKGLGCTQDYRMAVECFNAAAVSNHRPSLYMLGLCYRNGYGVEKNAATAFEYLTRSASLGYRDAREELERSNEETYLHETLYDTSDYSYIPDSMPAVSPKVNDTDMIAGDYQGYIVIYDWSGKFLLGEKPLSMSVRKNGNAVDGSMVVGVDTVPFRADVTSDNRMVFSKGNMMLRERYSGEDKVKYRMDDMVFDAWNNKICGRLNLYSLEMKEPERPMYFEFYRNSETGGTTGQQNNNVTIAPNPFETAFTAMFELDSDADVQALIFNTYGMMEWKKDLGHLAKGRHEVTLSPNIRSGKYIMSIKAGKQNFHVIIIKGGTAE